MQLPHLDEAHVSESKISGYLLADDHASGRSKALFFNNLYVFPGGADSAGERAG